MLKKDDIVEITIENIGSEGEGVGHYDGYTLFVKGAVPKDKLSVKVMKAKKNYGYARILEVLEPSPDRVEPVCTVSRQCGGCQLQHVSYEKQLEFKQNKILNNLIRIGNVSDAADKMEPIIGMDELYYYRNKAQYPVGIDKQGKICMGFYASRTHNIINTKECFLQSKANPEILQIVEDFLIDNKIPAYDEKTGKGIIRHIMTRIGYTTGEIMVCLVINADNLPKAQQQDLIDRLTKVENVKSICLNINKKSTNVIMGDKVRCIYGNEYIVDYIGDIKYQISPLSFYQVNPVQTKKLYELAMEYADLSGGEVVWDMYCGIGTISLFLAKKAKKVYGVEIVPQAIEDAKKNAVLNGIDNAEFFVGAAEDVVADKYDKLDKASVVVVDPPRKGCDEKLLGTLVKMQPEKIVYVSCDSATLARDVKWLGENGYEVKKWRGVDQFGMTVHVETVIALHRKDS